MKRNYWNTTWKVLVMIGFIMTNHFIIALLLLFILLKEIED